MDTSPRLPSNASPRTGVDARVSPGQASTGHLLPLLRISSLDLSDCSRNEIYVNPTGLLHLGLSFTETAWWAESTFGWCATCPCSRSWGWQFVQVMHLKVVSWSNCSFRTVFGQQYFMILRGCVVPKVSIRLSKKLFVIHVSCTDTDSTKYSCWG